MATVNYNINLEEMLLKIPAGPERKKAAIALDDFLGIPHIPNEGYEKDVVASSASQDARESSSGSVVGHVS